MPAVTPVMAFMERDRFEPPVYQAVVGQGADGESENDAFDIEAGSLRELEKARGGSCIPA